MKVANLFELLQSASQISDGLFVVHHKLLVAGFSVERRPDHV